MLDDVGRHLADPSCGAHDGFELAVMIDRLAQV